MTSTTDYTVDVIMDGLQTVRDGTLLWRIRMITEVVPILDERQHVVRLFACIIALERPGASRQ